VLEFVENAGSDPGMANGLLRDNAIHRAKEAAPYVYSTSNWCQESLVDLRRGDLRYADLSRAYLRGAYLNNASLINANLRNANLSEVGGLRHLRVKRRRPPSVSSARSSAAGRAER
jgi:uncharacterized protein YjbI with pentapeptide repeats